jgi:hypothetical protein
MKLINLTPHTINIITPQGENLSLPSAGVARVASQPGTALDFGAGIPVFSAPTWGAVEGLPEPEHDTLYVVSALVAGQVKGRPDVVSPGTGPNDGAVRNDKGQIVAVTRLIQSPEPGKETRP